MRRGYELGSSRVLSSFDDFPVHQTSLPIAHTVVGRPEPLRPLLLQRLHPRRPAVLRRGDGAVPEPARRRRGVQRRRRRWHASTHGRSTCTRRGGRRPTGPTPTRSGPIKVEVLEPLHALRLRGRRARSTGLRADLTFVRRSAPIEEPHFRHQVGVRVMFDYTRLTQFGGWEGWIEVDGELIDLDPGETWGSRDRSWGVRPGRRTRARPGHRSPTRSSSGCGRRSTSRRSRPISTSTSCSTAGGGTRPASSPRSTRGDGVLPEAMRAIDYRIGWTPGTRYAEAFEIDLVPWVGEPSTDPARAAVPLPDARHRLRAPGVEPRRLEGRAGRRRRPVGSADRADPTAHEHVHIQAIVRATTSGGVGEHEGIGILEQLALGRHVPTGLDGILDGWQSPLAGPPTPSRVADGHAAVDGDGGAVDERRARQAQVERHVGDLLRVAVPTQRHPSPGVGGLGVGVDARRSCRCRSGRGRCS